MGSDPTWTPRPPTPAQRSDRCKAAGLRSGTTYPDSHRTLIIHESLACIRLSLRKDDTEQHDGDATAAEALRGLFTRSAVQRVRSGSRVMSGSCRVPQGPMSACVRQACRREREGHLDAGPSGWYRRCHLASASFIRSPCRLVHMPNRGMNCPPPPSCALR